MAAAPIRRGTELGLQSCWLRDRPTGRSSCLGTVGADYVDCAQPPDLRLPAPAVRRVVPEDIDPGVGQHAAVLADVDTVRRVAANCKLGAQGEIRAAGRGALVHATAVGHDAAEALREAVVEREADARDAAGDY